MRTLGKCWTNVGHERNTRETRRWRVRTNPPMFGGTAAEESAGLARERAQPDAGPVAAANILSQPVRR